MAVKGILFSTDMVRAILDGRKTVTRRVIKGVSGKVLLGECVDGDKKDIGRVGFGTHEWGGKITYIKPPYQLGDYLYVRETWSRVFVLPRRYLYKADVDAGIGEGVGLPIRWHPSIHMPKEAARIWLKVTKLRVERIKDITEDEAHREGFKSREDFISAILKMYPDCTEDSWVWVIEFERCEKP